MAEKNPAREHSIRFFKVTGILGGTVATTAFVVHSRRKHAGDLATAITNRRSASTYVPQQFGWEDAVTHTYEDGASVMYPAGSVDAVHLQRQGLNNAMRPKNNLAEDAHTRNTLSRVVNAVLTVIIPLETDYSRQDRLMAAKE